MPDLQEVFRMATQKVKPDPGALDRQHGEQRRRTIRRKVGVYGLVAALIVVIAVMVVRARIGAGDGVPIDQPSSPTAAPGADASAGTVTFDGSTCSMEITADRIEPGVVVFDVVNATDKRVMFDAYQLVEGYRFEAFTTAIEHMRRKQENGKEGSFPEAGPGPDQQVRYFTSELVPANGSGSIVFTTTSGTHAIVCLQPFEGLGLRPFGIAGPFSVT